MLKLETIRSLLQDRRPNAVSEATGLSYGTIKAIRDGENTNPTLNVMQALSDYLEAKPNDQHI